MSLYRIHGDRRRCLRFLIEADEVEDKLGEGCAFHLDPSPKPYSDIWRPLRVVFHRACGSRAAALPDLDVRLGRLYLNGRACRALRATLSESGEFLPVTGAGGEGSVLNILRTAEDVGGLDERRSTKNPFGDLLSLAFHEARVAGLPVFRTAFDGYVGVYCNEGFKTQVEAAGLIGLLFSPDLGNPLGPDPVAGAPAAH